MLPHKVIIFKETGKQKPVIRTFLLILFHNSFKLNVCNNIISMEIFNIEDDNDKEKQVSEALRLLWKECFLEDIEAFS
ncbi:MAG: hypothetical protein QXN36_03115 [Candidatus Bathyarchaeia archaeon]